MDEPSLRAEMLMPLSYPVPLALVAQMTPGGGEALTT